MIVVLGGVDPASVAVVCAALLVGVGAGVVVVRGALRDIRAARVRADIDQVRALTQAGIADVAARKGRVDRQISEAIARGVEQSGAGRF